MIMKNGDLRDFGGNITCEKVDFDRLNKFCLRAEKNDFSCLKRRHYIALSLENIIFCELCKTAQQQKIQRTGIMNYIRLL